MNKRFLIVSLVLLAILTLGAVSASDVADGLAVEDSGGEILASAPVDVEGGDFVASVGSGDSVSNVDSNNLILNDKNMESAYNESMDCLLEDEKLSKDSSVDKADKNSLSSSKLGDGDKKDLSPNIDYYGNDTSERVGFAIGLYDPIDEYYGNYVAGNIDVYSNGSFVGTIPAFVESREYTYFDVNLGQTIFNFVYNGSDEFNYLNASFSWERYPHMAKIQIDRPDFVLANQDLRFSVNLTENGEILEKDFELVISDNDYWQDPSLFYQNFTSTGQGSYVIDSSNLTLGRTYFVRAYFKGEDGVYGEKSDYYYFTVIDKIDTYIDSYGNSIYTTDGSTSLYISLYDISNNFIAGSVDIYVNGTKRDTVSTSADSSTYVRLENLNPGLNKILLKYEGDDTYNPSNKSFNTTYYTKRAYIYIDRPSYVIFGQDYTFTVNLTDDEGNLLQKDFSVEVYDNDDESYHQSFSISGGAGSISIPADNLTLNHNYGINAQFNGEGDYAPDYKGVGFTVIDKIDTRVSVGYPTITTYDYVGLYITLNDYYTYEFLVGSVDIYVNGAKYDTVSTSADSSVEVQLDNLNLGLNEILVKYEGNDTYNPSNYSFNITYYSKQAYIQGNVPYIVAYDEPYTFNFNLTDDEGNLIKENFTITLLDSDYNLIENYTFENGSGTVNIPIGVFEVDKGYIFSYSFEGKGDYAPYNQYFRFEAIKKEEIEIDVRYNEFLSIDSTHIYVGLRNGEDYVDGEINVYLNGVPYAHAYPYDYEMASIYLYGLNIGSNEVIIESLGERYKPSNRTINIYRYVSSSSINIDGEGYLYSGKDNLIKVNVTDYYGELLEGNVSIVVYDSSDENLIQTLNLSTPGNFTIFASDLVLNHTYIINASFAGTDEIAPSNKEMRFIYSDVSDTEIILPESFDVTEAYCELSVGLKAGDAYTDSLVDIYLNGKHIRTIKTSSDGLVTIWIEEFKKGINNITAIFNGTDTLDPSNKTIEVTYNMPVFINGLSNLRIGLGGNLTINPQIKDYDEILDKEFTLCLKEYNYDEELGEFTTRTVETYNIIGEANITFDSSLFNYTFYYGSHYSDDTPYYYFVVDFEGGDYYLPYSRTLYFAVVPNETSVGAYSYREVSERSIVFAAYLLDYLGEDMPFYPLDIYLNDEFYRTVYIDYEYVARVQVNNLVTGLNKIDIKFNGFDGFAPSNYTFNVTIYEQKSGIIVDAPVVIKGNDAFITASLVDQKDGSIINKEFNVLIQDENVYWGDEGYSYSTNITGNGTIVIPASNLTNTRYYITVRFDGDENTSPFSYGYYYELYFDVVEYIGTYISVNDDEGIGKVIGGSVEFDLALFDLYEYMSLPGSLDIYLNDEFYSTAILESDDIDYYSAKVTVEGLKLGENIISISYNGTEIYSDCEKSYPLFNYANDSQINIEMPEYAFIGDNLVINVNMTDSEDNIIDKEFNVSLYYSKVVPGEYEANIKWILLRSYIVEGNQTIEVNTSRYPESYGFLVEAVYSPEDDYSYSSARAKERTMIINPAPYILVKSNYVAAGRSETVNVSTYLTTKEFDGDMELISLISLDLDVYINDVYFTTIKTSEDDIVSLELIGLEKGYNIIKFVFNGTDTYKPDEESCDIRVYDTVTKFIYDAPDIPLGEDAVISVKLVDANNESNVLDKQFSVSVSDGEYSWDGWFYETYNLTGNGTISIPAKFLSEGDYYLHFSFNGDENYSSENENAIFHVGDSTDLIPTSISLIGDEEVNESTVTVSIALIDVEDNEYISDMVDVYLNGELYDSISTSEDNTVELAIEGLSIGDNEIKVVYKGDDDFNASEAILIVKYTKEEPPVIVLPNGSFDLEITDSGITAILTDLEGKAIAGAQVELDLNGDKSNVTTGDGGKIVVPIDGNATVLLTYIDENGIPIRAGAKFTKETEEIPIVSDAVFYVNIVDGDVIACLVDGNDEPIEGAKIIVTVGDEDEKEYTTDSEGKIIVDLDDDATVNLVYTDEKGAQISYMVQVTNEGESEDIGYIIILDLCKNGTSIEVTLTDIDNVPISNGEVIVYLSEDDEEGTIVSLDEEGVGFFDFDNTQNQSMEFTFTDGNEAVWSSYYEHIVNDHETTLLVNGSFDVTVGEDSITAVLTDSDGKAIAGTYVSVEINGVESDMPTDDDGSIVVPLDGNATVVFTYMDENGLTVSTSAKFVKEIEEVEVEVPVLANGTMSVEATDDAVVATLVDSDGKPIEGAQITALVDGVESNFTTDADGKVTVPVGDNATVELSYTDPENGASIQYSTKVVTNVVEVPVEVPVVSKGSFNVVGNETDVKAILLDENDKPITNASVEMILNGVASNVTTGADGSIDIPIDKNATLTLTYTEENGAKLIYTTQIITNIVEKEIPVPYVPNRTATTIKYSNMTMVAVPQVDGRIGKYFEVTLLDADGNPLANKPIAIGFNGKAYDRTTNATGGAKLQINLNKVDLYTFAICFLGDDNYTASFVVAVINVTPHTPKLTAPAKSYKSTAKTKTLTATLKTSNGNVVKGKKISFTVNGKTYTATTNAKGVASVKVTLTKKGSYTATAKFAGDDTFKATSTSFKVTIK